MMSSEQRKPWQMITVLIHDIYLFLWATMAQVQETFNNLKCESFSLINWLYQPAQMICRCGHMSGQKGAAWLNSNNLTALFIESILYYQALDSIMVSPSAKAPLSTTINTRCIHSVLMDSSCKWLFINPRKVCLNGFESY